MDEYCRFCTTQKVNLIPLVKVDNIVKIKTILKIKTDRLPQKICDTCLIKINDINAFVETCEKSYEYFNTVLSEDDDFKDDEDSELFKAEPRGLETDSSETRDIESINFKKEVKEEYDEMKYENSVALKERQSNFLKNENVTNCKTVSDPEESKKINEESIFDDQKTEKGTNLLHNDSISNSAISTINNLEQHKTRKIRKKTEQKRRSRSYSVENNGSGNMWKCQYCPRIFTTDKILRRHMQNIHTNPNFKCVKCGFECTNKSNCAGHVKRKHFKELNMEFEELLQFVLEKDTNIEDVNFSDLPFPCDGCTRSFAKERDLEKHKNRVHISDPDSAKLFGCKQCGSKYTYRKTAVKHIRNVHYESRTELVKAEIDEYLTQYGIPRTESDVSKTTKKENVEEGTVHECPVCHLKYSSSIILKSHFARFHLSEDEKKKRKKKIYLCQQCGKKFSARSAFQYHVQTHFGKKEFKCNECSKAYYTKHLLLSHMRKHTGDTSNRQLECEICHKKWPSKTALERHMNVHGQKQPRNFMCSICGNAFYSNYHLRSHMLRHTKENNFKCTEPGCNASFRADGSRKKHFHNFHLPDDQKPFSCDICQKKFFRKSYLVDHLRKHGKAGENMLHLYRQKIPEEAVVRQ